jgi:hypothetical protein
MNAATGAKTIRWFAIPQRENFTMMKTILALGAAAVALTATPALADRGHHNGWRHHSKVCVKTRHGHCVRWSSNARRAQYNMGYHFGRNYGYTSYRAIPRVYVRRYDLNPRYRYVYRDNYIYQVDPTTYAVTRVIDALTR